MKFMLHRLLRHTRTYATCVPPRGTKVVVAMSGGVDSSVAAALLAQKECDLSAVFMRNWDTRDESGSDIGCEWEKDWEDVRRVCKHIGIPCEMRDFSKEYWNRVFTPALDAWRDGRTPNPDVFCNREIKFGAFFDHVIPSDQTYLATGHYAQITYHNSRPRLTRAADPCKDQTYYLSSVRESRLARTLFPIGHLTKPALRSLAKEMNLPTAERGESMGLCFVGERRKFDQFLSDYIPPTPGPVLLHPHLTKVGTHQGLWTLTIGQNARIPGQPTKLFVARKDNAGNAIIVVDRMDHPALMCTSIRLRGWEWILESEEGIKELEDKVRTPDGMQVLTQIRHRMNPVPGRLRKILTCTSNAYSSGETTCAYEISFAEPIHGVAPGQVGAAWDGTWCLGCGEIESTVCLE